MATGLGLLCIGYIIPREYVFDPSLPARQMEAIELRHAKLVKGLDICIIIGMGFTAFGGILVASLTTYGLIKGFVDNSNLESDKDKMMDSDIEMTSYGSRGAD